MRVLPAALLVLTDVQRACAQQIWDIWSTTWDRSSLLTRAPMSTPINFVTPSVIGDADIVVNSSTYQSVWGFGGSLTDSSAYTLNNLKAKNSTAYWNLLEYLFDPTDGKATAGLSYIRVSIGASDFSLSLYSYDDTSGDTSLSKFNIGRAPSYLFSTLQDIANINPILHVHVLPWSPPGWMKSTGTMDGGSFTSSYVSTYAQYLLKALQGFQAYNISVYAISIQNEPQNSDSTYPSCTLSVTLMGKIGQALRPLMNAHGFSGVKIIGYEHNWDDAALYPVQLMQSYGSYFDGVAFHCYAGTVDQQDAFHVAFPKKEIYFTECSGTIGSDWWSDIKWYMENLFIGAITHNAHSGLMWNIALDGTGSPKLPGTDSCGGSGCRAIVTVNRDGTWSVNQEFYAMAQASRAVLPKDVGGPWGKRIGVAVGGNLNWALVVGAYVTGRVNASDWLRYSLVVLNSDDSPNGSWDPTPVQTTIEFQDMQATYIFPVGVTTLWWYAPPASSTVAAEGTQETLEAPLIYGEHEGQQVLGGRFNRGGS